MSHRMVSCRLGKGLLALSAPRELRALCRIEIQDFPDIGADEKVVKSSSLRSTSILCFPQQEGRRGISLGLQAGVLLLLVARVGASAIHLVTQVNHKVVERLKRSLDLVRKGYVEHVQSTMSFGGRNNAWQGVEVDEAVFDKTLIPIEQAECPSKIVEWEQWVGPVQRGKPTSLILLRLSPKHLFCK